MSTRELDLITLRASGGRCLHLPCQSLSRAILPRLVMAVMTATMLSLATPSYATSDTNIRPAVEVLLTQQWRQIGTSSSQPGTNRDLRLEEMRATVHLTKWSNGGPTECPDGFWEADVTYQVEFISGGYLSRFSSTATAVLRHDEQGAWSAIRLNNLHIKGGIVGDQLSEGRGIGMPG